MSGATFRYVALDARGGRARGRVVANDRAEAYRSVATSGLTPLAVEPTRAGRARGSRVRTKEVAHLTSQLAVLLEASIPIAEALRSIGAEERNPRLRGIVDAVAREIEGGSTITSALGPHRDVFGEVYVETVRAAERSGRLPEVLDHLATMLDRKYETAKSVKSALMYPACVVGTLVLAVSFLTVFVVPRFAAMFESRGLDLPPLTRALIAASEVARDRWYVLVVGAGVAGWLARAAWRDETWRGRLDALLGRVPVLRELLTGLAVSRFAHVFGLSLRSGLGLIEALSMAGAASGRARLRRDAARLEERVRQGGRLADALPTCEEMPGFAKRMMRAGEEAAEMPRMCRVIARHYDREVEHLAKDAATLIEPILIVLLASVILVFALAIFLPMWNVAALAG